MKRILPLILLGCTAAWGQCLLFGGGVSSCPATTGQQIKSDPNAFTVAMCSSDGTNFFECPDRQQYGRVLPDGTCEPGKTCVVARHIHVCGYESSGDTECVELPAGQHLVQTGIPYTNSMRDDSPVLLLQSGTELEPINPYPALTINSPWPNPEFVKLRAIPNSSADMVNFFLNGNLTSSCDYKGRCQGYFPDIPTTQPAVDAVVGEELEETNTIRNVVWECAHGEIPPCGADSYNDDEPPLVYYRALDHPKAWCGYNGKCHSAPLRIPTTQPTVTAMVEDEKGCIVPEGRTYLFLEASALTCFNGAIVTSLNNIKVYGP